MHKLNNKFQVLDQYMHLIQERSEQDSNLPSIQTALTAFWFLNEGDSVDEWLSSRVDFVRNSQTAHPDILLFPVPDSLRHHWALYVSLNVFCK